MRLPRPCIEHDCDNYAIGGKRGARCRRCQRRVDRWRNALASRRPYADPAYKAIPVVGLECALKYEGICTGRAETRDHITPLSEGGTNHPSNIQPACRACNSAKHNR